MVRNAAGLGGAMGSLRARHGRRVAYSRTVLRRALLACVLVLAGNVPMAHAGGLDFDVAGARGAGRAGAILVSEDGGPALWINPAGMARRDAFRMQLATTIHDSDSRFRAAGAEPDTPLVVDRGPARGGLGVAAQGPLGPFIVGAAYLELGDLCRMLPRPQPDQPTDPVLLLFPHRYGGTGLVYRRRAWLAGAAMRARPWLGVGVSAGIAQVRLGEVRHVWAGFAGREPLGDPGRDLVLSLGGSDSAVPMISAGALIAPPPLPIEIALSMSYAAAAELGGAASLTATRSTEFPAPELTNPRGEAVLPGSVVLRAGVRYLGERVLVEAGGDLTLYTGSSPQWTVSGVSVRDSTGATGVLGQVPSLADMRSHGALRAAADVEAVRGFVWLTAGYAYRTGSSRTAHMTPVHADPGGHIVAVGAESQWGNMVFTIGYSRMLQSAVAVDASRIATMMINPFDGGSQPVGAGTYEGAVDMFGAGLDIAW